MPFKSMINTQISVINLLSRDESVETLVKLAYPDFPWDPSKFVQRQPGKAHFSAQLLLLRMLQSIFPGIHTSDNRIAKVNLVSDAAVDTNVRYGHNIMGDKTHPLEIDIYFPSLNLGFEYQVIFPAKVISRLILCRTRIIISPLVMENMLFQSTHLSIIY